MTISFFMLVITPLENHLLRISKKRNTHLFKSVDKTKCEIWQEDYGKNHIFQTSCTFCRVNNNFRDRE